MEDKAGTSETPTDGLGARQAPHLRRQGEHVTASSRLARRQLCARRCGYRGGTTAPREWTLSGVGRQAKQGSLEAESRSTRDSGSLPWLRR